MKDNTSTAIIAPDLNRLVLFPRRLEKLTAEAFEYADPTRFRDIFAMREFLHYIYPDNANDCKTPDEYVSRLEKIIKQPC